MHLMAGTVEQCSYDCCDMPYAYLILSWVLADNNINVYKREWIFGNHVRVLTKDYSFSQKD